MLLTKTQYIKVLKIVLQAGKDEDVCPNTMFVFYEDKEYLLLWEDYICIAEIFRDKNVTRCEDSAAMAETDSLVFFIKEKDLDTGLSMFWNSKINKLAELRFSIEDV